MTKDFDALLENRTWELFTLPIGKKAITRKWVFKIKLKVDEALERYKAQLVAKSYLQIVGLDCGETFSPIIKLNHLGYFKSCSI